MMIEWISTCAPDVNCWAEPFEHIVLGLASVVGGAWVILRFLRERKWDSALAIDIKSSFLPTGQQTLTFVEVRLRNKGKVQLRAKVYPTENGLAFDDGVEELKYSCSLRLKKLVTPVTGDSWIDWFDDTNFVSPQLLEVNLLNEYEDPEQNNRTDFWMEPGEVYKLGVPVTLASGIYLAKVTFIGSRSDSEFWSRMTLLRIAADTASASGSAGGAA